MTSDSGQALPVVNNVFAAGDPRVMENPELTGGRCPVRERTQLVDRDLKPRTSRLERRATL